MLKVEIPCNDTFLDNVVVHLNVLFPSMEYQILSQVDVAKVDAVDQDWVVDGDTKVFQDSLKPYGSACCHDYAPVFCVSARQCNYQLLFVALGYGYVA